MTIDSRGAEYGGGLVSPEHSFIYEAWRQSTEQVIMKEGHSQKEIMRLLEGFEDFKNRILSRKSGEVQ